LNQLPNYDEKIEFLDQCEALIQPNMPDIQKQWIFLSLREVDRVERQNFCQRIISFGPHAKSPEFLAQLGQLDRANRWQIATNAFRLNSLFLKSEIPDDLASLLEFSSRIPPAEMEQFISHAREIISIWTPKSSRIKILDELSKLSPAERRSASSMISRWMSSETRIELLKNLHNHPRLQAVQNHISFYMNGTRRVAILRELRDRAVLVSRREERLINRISRYVHRWLPRPAAPIAAQAPIREDSWTPVIVRDDPLLGSRFLVNLPYLKAFPLNIASSLPLIQMQYPVLPRIKYTANAEGADDLGIDAGGLTRDFISQLFVSLFDQEQPDRRLPVQSHERGCFPLLEGTDQQKQKLVEVYQGIGWIYALAIQKHSDITTGIHFHQGLFDMMHSLESTDFEYIPDGISSCDFILPDVYQKLLKSYLKSSCRLQFGMANADPVQIDRDIEAFVENGTLNQYHILAGIENVDDVLAPTKAKETILAALNIAKSMHKTLGATRWNQIKAQNAEMLNGNIQGLLTKELVLEAFGLDNGPAAGLHAGWVQRYVNELGDGEADRRKLKQFVWAISGKTSISPSPGQLFTIRPQVASENFPAFHTCTKEIDIPTYPDYDTFKRKLDYVIAYAVATGNFGLA